MIHARCALRYIGEADSEAQQQCELMMLELPRSYSCLSQGGPEAITRMRIVSAGGRRASPCRRPDENDGETCPKRIGQGITLKQAANQPSALFDPLTASAELPASPGMCAGVFTVLAST